ncbi:MAG TPA: hypothetical protein VGF79_04880 [Bacteroidia bacterium]
MKILKPIFISILLFALGEIQGATAADSLSKKTDTVNVLQGLDLKRVPGVDTLYRVAKKYMGRWHYLFLAIKIEESGNSGHYSWLSVNHYNLCGMRFPKSRRTYAIGATNTNYAIYRNWFECMLDFKIYMENLEAKFVNKYKRAPKDDVEMINYMYNSFNHFAKWKKDMLILIKYVKKKYK